MAEYWEWILNNVEALFPPEIAQYETEAFIVAVITSILAFLGEFRVR